MNSILFYNSLSFGLYIHSWHSCCKTRSTLNKVIYIIPRAVKIPKLLLMCIFVNVGYFLTILGGVFLKDHSETQMPSNQSNATFAGAQKIQCGYIMASLA